MSKVINTAEVRQSLTAECELLPINTDFYSTAYCLIYRYGKLRILTGQFRQPSAATWKVLAILPEKDKPSIDVFAPVTAYTSSYSWGVEIAIKDEYGDGRQMYVNANGSVPNTTDLKFNLSYLVD